MQFHIKMVPVPKGRPRMTRTGHCFTPQKTHDAERLVRLAVQAQYPGPPLMGPVSVVMRFWLPKPKSNRKDVPWGHSGDLTNYAKTVEDALNKVLYDDDCQIVHLEASKHYCAAGGEPGIDLEVTLLT